MGRLFESLSKKRKLRLSVRCSRCGELISVLIDPDYEVERTYSEEEPPYILKKELRGERCPNVVYVKVAFDHNWGELWREVEGGIIEKMEWVDL